MAYRILSFCGGGIRGLMSAMILSRLSQAFRDKYGVSLHQRADCIAGTSTGSFITGMLMCDVDPEIIVGLYDDVLAPGYRLGKTDPTHPAFASSDWIAILDHYHADRRLRHFETQNCVFTSFDIGGPDRAWAPMLLNNFPGSDTADFGLLDAMAASGAMPGMCSPHDVIIGDRSYRLVDGAFVHHDPTIPAVALAVSSGVPLDEVSAIDIGTGFMRNFVTADASGWGSLQWTYGSGTKDGQLPPLLANNANETPILNLTLSGTSTNLMPDLARMLLGDRFAYLNPDFGSRVISEMAADPESLAFLRDQAMTCDIGPALAVLDEYWAD
jgi:hypothetical protein